MGREREFNRERRAQKMEEMTVMVNCHSVVSIFVYHIHR